MTENERYTERVRDVFGKFLISNFVEYKPYMLSDDEIIADAKGRSTIYYNGGLLRWAQNFVSIVTVEGSQDMEYNGKDFKQLLLKSEDGNIRRLNFSDFHYYNSLYVGKDSNKFGFGFDASKAKYVNLLDTQRVNPESLASNVGRQLLIGYSFNTVNNRDSMRTCYRLYSLNCNQESDASTIRKQILRAQAFILLLALKYPVVCLPSYNGENIYPYMYEITKEVGAIYAPQLRAKLHEVEQSLLEHGLTYENSL